MYLSVVLPIYNERENIKSLFARLRSALKQLPHEYEIIAVDDGSTDGSFDALIAEARQDARVHAIRFKTNFGQTAALAAGIESARGTIIVTIDSDLENDPADIPRLLEKLNEGYDVVSGWRKDRWKGAFVTRRLPSRVANWLISQLTGVHLHDYGCTLKVYRADVIKGVRLYGEMHRFIPAYAAQSGGRVTELPVQYAPRRFGKSNYGISRTFRVLLDLILIRFLERYMNRPIHFFGGVGFVLLFLSVFTGMFAVFLRVVYNLHFVQTPLPMLAVFLLLMAVNMIMMGVIGEMLMRTYYESQGRRPYIIRES